MKYALVVACTNGKSRPPVVRLGRVRGRAKGTSTEALFESWSAAFDGVEQGRVAAETLYSGVAWSAARAVGDAVRGLAADVECWVTSAGYGLVRWDQLLVPYSATFSPGHADSVAAQSSGDYRRLNAQWWAHLTDWRPRGHRGPRSFRSLAGVVDRMMIVMSPRYLDAAGDDVADAAASMSSCVVISGGLPRSHRLAQYGVRFDKRLRESEDVTGAPRLLDASDMSLNQRLAEHLVSKLGADALDLSKTRRYVHSAMRSRRPARTYEHRSAASDEEVASFIESELLRDPGAAKTPLLHKWRQLGRQCEQKRFGRIFEETKAAFELAGLEGAPTEART